MYQYRIERFDACLAAKRAAKYCENIEPIRQNEKLMEYLQHGFFVLHAIFSFDGCLQYLNKQEWHDGKERPDRPGGCILICNRGNYSLSFFNHSSNMYVNGHYWPTKWKYLFK